MTYDWTMSMIYNWTWRTIEHRTLNVTYNWTWCTTEHRTLNMTYNWTSNSERDIQLNMMYNWTSNSEHDIQLNMTYNWTSNSEHDIQLNMTYNWTSNSDEHDVQLNMMYNWTSNSEYDVQLNMMYNWTANTEHDIQLNMMYNWTLNMTNRRLNVLCSFEIALSMFFWLVKMVYDQNTNISKLDVLISDFLFFYLYSKWKLFERYMKKNLKYFPIYLCLNSFAFESIYIWIPQEYLYLYTFQCIWPNDGKHQLSTGKFSSSSS